MNGKGIVTTLDLLLHWITRLVVVSILWIVFSLAGLLAGGIFPATAAALGVSRKWLMGDSEVKILKAYKKIYKQEFIAANIIGWILTLIGIVLYINFRLIIKSEGELPIITPFAFYLILFFYIITALWSFPLLVHYNDKWFKHVKHAFIIGLTKLHYTFFMGLILFSIIYLSLLFPGVIPFFTISIAAICWMWFALQVFGKLDERTT